MTDHHYLIPVRIIRPPGRGRPRVQHSVGADWPGVFGGGTRIVHQGAPSCRRVLRYRRRRPGMKEVLSDKKILQVYPILGTADSINRSVARFLNLGLCRPGRYVAIVMQRGPSTNHINFARVRKG